MKALVEELGVDLGQTSVLLRKTEDAPERTLYAFERANCTFYRKILQIRAFERPIVLFEKANVLFDGKICTFQKIFRERRQIGHTSRLSKFRHSESPLLTWDCL